MPLHHDIVSRCCDCFNCPLPVTTLIWGTAIKMKCWSFIFTTSSVTLLLFWRCKRFFPVAYSHTKMAATVKNLTFTDEELPLHVLVGYKQKRKAKALIGRLWKQSGMSSTKSLSKNITKTFRKSFCEESANNRNNNISDLYWALSVIKGANRQIDLRHLPKAHN